MAEMLKRQFDLLTLRIAMDLSADAPKVHMQLQAHQEGQPDLLNTWSFEASTIGLPETLERSSTTYQGYHFSFPDDVLFEIKDALANSDYGDKPLWIHLAKPLARIYGHTLK